MTRRDKCKCSKEIQKICKSTLSIGGGGPNDIAAILEFRENEAKMKKEKKFRPPNLKIKKYKPLRVKEKRIPMYPPMHMRLKFLHHCDPEPYKRTFPKRPRIRYTEDLLSSEDEAQKQQRLKKEERMLKEFQRNQVILPVGPTFVRHGQLDSDTSLIRVPSPKLSGVNVCAQRAPVKPTELKPPLPPKAGFEVYQTHSGIIINQDKDFATEGGGGGKAAGLRQKKVAPCAKGGVCTRKKCRRKKCRKFAAMRRRQMARAVRSGKHMRDKPCSALTARGGKGGAGARDGRPRAKFLRSGSVPRDDTGCGLDEVERPDYPEIPAGLKRGAFRTHSLTVVPCTKDKRAPFHFGILMGNLNLYSDKFGKSRGRQGLPMSIMAYCLAYHYHPKQWNAKLIDALMVAADQWYNQLFEKVHDHSAYQGICEVFHFGKQKVVLLNKKKMQVLLCEPEIIGYAMSLDPTVYNLCRGLKAFFGCPDTRACILMTRSLKIVIWRDKVCFYLFDPSGRDIKAYSNFANGKAALINVLDLDSIIDLLLARSIIEDQKFLLAPIKVLAMVSQTEELDLDLVQPTQAEKAKMSYRILSENLAIVNANMHLGDRIFEDNKFHQALTIAVAALTYAKISPPSTWYSKTLDKIIRLGNKLYVDFKNPKITFEMGIDNIPNEIVLGPFICEVIIYRERTKGQLFTTKECILNIKTGLRDFFNHEYSSGIIDFSNYKLAVWKQKDMYYLFDPYPRTDDGLRALKSGKACCFMLLDTDAIAAAFTKNWDFLPVTTPFVIHAFKVLKLSQGSPKNQLVVSLSATKRKGRSRSRRRREPHSGSVASLRSRSGRSWSGSSTSGKSTTVMRADTDNKNKLKEVDEENMGEIISLVDSIQDEFVPPIPRKFRDGNAAEPEPVKLHNLDSPTVSVTQVVPPWPKPRDKTNEPPDRDPSPEPTPPPTPPPPVPPEGEEEAEEEEEELDEEALKRKKEEELRRKAEEEEARRKAEELPPAIPPPPPTPLLEDGGLPPKPGAAGGAGGAVSAGAPGSPGGGAGPAAGRGDPALADTLGGGYNVTGEEIPMQEDDIDMEPVPVERYILLTEDAKKRYKIRQQHAGAAHPSVEPKIDPPFINKEGMIVTTKDHNFTSLLDSSQIMSGTTAIPEKDVINVLPFVAIMAVVTSYKYLIDTWTHSLVDFVVSAGQKLSSAKLKAFQVCSLHIIPKIAIGNQAYHVNIDVVTDGPTWSMEHVLSKAFFPKYDRGIITMPFYSCAIFIKDGLYYLFDGSECNAMGVRNQSRGNKKAKPNGKACFLRFITLRDLVNRIQYNKGGYTDEAQFVVSRLQVRRLLAPLRTQLPDDYDYKLQMSNYPQKTIEGQKPKKMGKKDKVVDKEDSPTGYVDFNGIQRINGTTTTPLSSSRGVSGPVKPEHFVCLMAMLMATIHPFKRWNSFMVDNCIETGLEITSKATNLDVCEKRVIKNIVIDGKFVNLNVKKIIVINENPEKFLEQYMKAVMDRLRYVLVRFPGCDLVVVQSNGLYHLFDPQAPPPNLPVEENILPKAEEPRKKNRTMEEIEADYKRREKEKEKEVEKKIETIKKQKAKDPSKVIPAAAGWTLYRTLDGLIQRIKLSYKGRSGTKGDNLNSPEFYTFELTSMRPAPKHAMLNFKLSPLFRPDENPNRRFILPMKPPRPLVSEKMYWLNVENVPWSRCMPVNDKGLPRGTPASMWKAWDIEFPGDLCSLWGNVHPRDRRFSPQTRGDQYLACCITCCALTQVCSLATWTQRFIDGIVINGDKYHQQIYENIKSERNHEVVPEDYAGVPGEIYPFRFTPKFEKVIFGFVYNMLQDRFNLSNALSYFFEKYETGLLLCSEKNLAFGKIKTSYFMFDCQSKGSPLFNGGAYILKCESLNRLIYCMAMALQIRAHNQQFNLYSINLDITELDTKAAAGGGSTSALASSASSRKSSKTDSTAKSK